MSHYLRNVICQDVTTKMWTILYIPSMTLIEKKLIILKNLLIRHIDISNKSRGVLQNAPTLVNNNYP